MKTTLLIMAAGIGSRFGTGIKQLEPVDDAGHIIMDYSIHDAIEAGFNHVVFIIRKDIEKEFKEVIGDRIASICSSHNVTVDYAFQDINDIPGTLPEGRTKPWGTGQAVLAAKKVIKTPFIVINADDYYGKEGFKAVHEYLVNGGKSCMAGFVLKNTLSDNGGVTRGICKMDDQNNLTEVVETKNIIKTADGAEDVYKRQGYDEMMNVICKRATTTAQIQEMRGSKFVQSTLGNTFEKIKNELLDGVYVMFTGSPCQIAGLLHYLKKKPENLLCVDFVCRGVPSPGLWRNYVDFMEEKFNSKIVGARFKHKTYGYHTTTMKIDFDNGKTYYGSGRVDPYMKSFVSELASRPSCAYCAFKGLERPSDITIFDCYEYAKLRCV